MHMHNLLEVSVAGLLVNLVGIFAFSHAHTHGGEACDGNHAPAPATPSGNHSHGGQACSHAHGAPQQGHGAPSATFPVIMRWFLIQIAYNIENVVKSDKVVQTNGGTAV